MKKILILTYTFPPSPSIGGRRWAKFAKYMDRAGHDICVLASDIGRGQKSPWQSDIQSLLKKEKVVYLKNGYPNVLDSYPEGVVDKLKYRLAILKVKKEVRGNYYDRSSYWQKSLFPKLRKKLEEGYDTVIATGAPFQYLYYLTELIPDFPNVKFIADIRDPWANNKTAYGFETLSDERKKEVLHFEQQVMSKFNHVVTVYDETTSYFKNRSLGKTAFHTVSNGYDSEDFSSHQFIEKKKSDHLRFVLTGSLYDPALHIFRSFVDELKELSVSHPNVFKSLRFDFYGRKNTNYAPFFDDPLLKDTLYHHGMVSIEEVYQNINEADICLLFLTDDMNYSKSTKFFEYIAQRRKIAVFSTPGETGKEVTQQKIGYAMSPGNIQEGFIKIHSDWTKDNLSFPTDFDSSHFEVADLTKRYLALIEE